MPGWQQQQQRKQTDGQELWAKDRTMASMNAATVASQLVQLEVEVQRLTTGEPAPTDPVSRFLELYEVLYEQHLQRGGDVGAAVATVTRAFPGSEVAVAADPAPVGGNQQSFDSGPGAVAIGFGKHAGQTIAQVYAVDPTYIRNYLAEKAREPELLNAARAFITQVDAA